LVLAVIGLYGVVSCAVASRSREVGIRLSLGAGGGSIVRLLMRSGLTLVAVGAVIGMGLAFAISQSLGSLLFAVDARDPIVFLSVPVLLAAAAIIATLLPARRALQLSPTVVLRSA
jgi:ABC-type antimicrobial peptide transport system permease subunit